MLTWLRHVAGAVQRARLPIITVAITYAASILVGILMVHAGNTFALETRDRLVNQALQQSSTSQAAAQGKPLQAALLDFAGNLVLGSVPKALSGLAILPAYPWVAYQGWIGGIVSVRADHSSRLNDVRSAVYYLLTLILQLVPYSLAIGAGVNTGLAMLRPKPYYQGEKWVRLLPKEALRDMGWIYTVVVPLFLVASLWEFFSPWNV